MVLLREQGGIGADGRAVLQRQHREAERSLARAAAPAWSERGSAVVCKGRAGGLEGDDGFHEVWAGVAELPVVHASFRVRDDYCGSDVVEEGVEREIVVDGLHRAVCLSLELRPHEGVECRITLKACSGPLRMVNSLWIGRVILRSSELLFNLGYREL